MTSISKIIAVFVFFVVFSLHNMSGQNSIETFFENLKMDQLKTVAPFVGHNDYKQALKNLLEIYRKKDNLYLHVDKGQVAYIKNTYPTEVRNSIEVADQVLDHFFLFRYDWDMEKTNIPHQFKDEIDWTAIPNGDEEWCYMLNRHRYWNDLGKAYLLTGKEKYAKGFVEQTTHWIDNNPLTDELKHLSWRRIEAGIRSENWIKAFEYVKDSKHVTPDFLMKFLNSLHEHGMYLNSNFSNFSQTSNWGVLEFQGLYNLALF